MKIQHHDRWRSFFATLCLFAVALLYAPLGGAAWSLYSAACCTSGQCPIHGHHHQNSPASSPNPMDCGHEMPGTSKCTLSCCHNSEHSVVAPVLFVLPPIVNISAPSELNSSVIFPTASVDLRSLGPLSPPPRLSSAAA